jgi:GT2 family glycosyltransferase
MPTHITTIELSSPLPEIPLSGNASGLLALVRWRGRPVGLAWLRNVTGDVSPSQLRAAITSQVAYHHNIASTVTTTNQLASIIVCTHERPDDLRRCLDALVPLAAAGHEVLVVDNAPRSTRTADVVAEYPFRYLCEPRVGLNHARNCGLRAASHPIVAYTDDDAVAEPDWLTALIQPFQTSRVGCVTGLVLPLELETPAQEAFEIYCAHRRDFTRRVLVAPEIPPAAGGLAGMGANMAFRRELLLQLGGFDPRLDGGTATCSGGDTDMFARVLEAGAQIVYTPEAVVWHRHRRTEAELRSCIFGYGVGLYSFLTKRLIEARDLQALVIGVRWLVGPLAKAAWRQLRGRPTVSLDLLLLELRGALLGPVQLWRETRAAAFQTESAYSEKL